MQNRLSIPLNLSLRADQDKVQLSLAQKALVEWAKVDDHSAILDMDCEDGKLLNYYSKRFHLRSCGIAVDSERLASALALCGYNAEILRGVKTDIPWKASTFHAVFLSAFHQNCRAAKQVLTEAFRVMKPGAQLLILAPGFHLFSRFSVKQAEGISDDASQPQALMKLLENVGFDDISMRVSNVRYATIVAYKQTKATDDTARE